MELLTLIDYVNLFSRAEGVAVAKPPESILTANVFTRLSPTLLLVVP
jgi:hypothetical protein